MYHTYIVTNKPNGIFYTGVTSNLAKRIFEHKQGLVRGFSKKYNLKILVYCESYENVIDAIAREKLIKRWKRSIKINSIEKNNSEWKDLYYEL